MVGMCLVVPVLGRCDGQLPHAHILVTWSPPSPERRRGW